MDREIKTNNNRRWIYLAVVIVSSAIFILFVISISSDSSYKVNEKHIVVSEVQVALFEDFIPIRATVEPLRSVFVDVVEGGQIDKLLIEEGSLVKAGDVILTLNNTRLQLDVISREAEISRQISNLQNTRLAIEQNKLKLDIDLIDLEFEIDKSSRIMESYHNMKSDTLFPELDYKNAQSELRRWKKRKLVILESQKLDNRIRTTQLSQLQSNIDHLQQNLAVVSSMLDKLEVKARVNGRLTSLNAELGQSIVQGQRLGQIDDVGRFRTTALVSEHYLNRVNLGQKTKLTINGQEYIQVLKKVYPEVNNSQFRIDLEFVDDTPPDIRRGQSFSLKLQLNNTENVLVLANGLFFSDTGGAWVFLVDEYSGVARKQYVKFGRRSPSQIEVLSGLNRGDRVLTSSYQNFKTADNINISNSK